jgi:aminoglycoside/choline kinase family phosphotransferase
MILSDGSCGVLDYQDALFGPVTYDIVSLTEDARMTVSPELEAHVWNRYLEHIPKSKHEAYRHQGDILSAGRHAKILGVFARYDLKYNNASKLCYLDYVEKLLMRSLERSGANEIIHLLKDIT